MHQRSSQTNCLKRIRFQKCNQPYFSKIQTKKQSIFKNQRIDQNIKNYNSNRLKTDNGSMSKLMVYYSLIKFEKVGSLSFVQNDEDPFKHQMNSKFKISKNKLWNNKKTRWHSFGHADKLSQIMNCQKPNNSLSIKSFKPINRYPHQYATIQIVEKCLQYKPVHELGYNIFSNPFKRHKALKAVIHRRESSQKKYFAKQRQKLLNRKKWM